VIKVNIWSVDEIDWNHFDKVWNDFFIVNPSMTIAYISALGLPEIKIEIEILAAKSE
jgi:enamine deaminase RidA (YjgF/YER057c/UK114 family)